MSKSRIKRKLHKDNRGSGLIMVLIMVAFLGILAAILMFAAYGGYQMRLVDKQGKDNFYTAETVLDEINVGLQEKASEALSKAYQDVMVNYSLYETPEARSQKLYQVYYNELQQALQQDATNTTHYNINLLREFVSEELYGDGENADGSREKFGTYGAIVESNVGSDIYTLALKDNGIVIKDLKVTYVNQRGYVSIISTDIRIALPRVNFSQSSAFPDLAGYCLIADKGMLAGNTASVGSISISGDVYADSMVLGAQSGVDHNGANFVFVEGTQIEFSTPEAETPEEESANIFVVSKNDVEVEKATLKTTSVDLWSRNITLDSAEGSLSGNTYVQNDLQLEGIRSAATLSGTYTGFGTSVTQTDDSSAIVVNSRESSLDLSTLNSLNVSGHTYVATTSDRLEDAEPDGEEFGEADTEKDILMGESVAVKSNQLIYLVPPEVLGCEILKDGTIGDSVYRSNPLRIGQYQDIKNNPDKYVMLAADKPVSLLKNRTLSEYMVPQEIVGGEPEYRPIVVVKQTNAGSLVYCYMQFKDENAANQYFRDYYGVNAEAVDRYTRIYADAIKMPAEDNNLVYLHLAGNVLAYEGEETQIVEATDNVIQKKRAQELSLVRSDMFHALTSKMVTNIAQLTVEEQNNTVFTNIIDKESLIEVVENLRDDEMQDTVTIETVDGSKSVVLSTGNYTIDGTKLDEDKVCMVICLGDVRVKKDFAGVIIAGGKVIIGDEKDVDKKVELTTLSKEEFTEILLAKKEKNDTNYYVLDVFHDGANYAGDNAGVADYGTEQVNLSDLIIYERWSKQ